MGCNTQTAAQRIKHMSVCALVFHCSQSIMSYVYAEFQVLTHSDIFKKVLLDGHIKVVFGARLCCRPTSCHFLYLQVIYKHIIRLFRIIYVYNPLGRLAYPIR